MAKNIYVVMQDSRYYSDGDTYPVRAFSRAKDAESFITEIEELAKRFYGSGYSIEDDLSFDKSKLKKLDPDISLWDVRSGDAKYRVQVVKLY